MRSLGLLCFPLFRIICIWDPDKQYFTLSETHSLVNSMFFIQDESKKHLVVSTRIHRWHLQQEQWELQSDSSSLRINLELCSCCFPLQVPEHSNANYSSFVNWFSCSQPEGKLSLNELPPWQTQSIFLWWCRGKPAQQTGRKATALGHLLPVTKAQRVEAQVPRPKTPVNTELIGAERA